MSNSLSDVLFGDVAMDLWPSGNDVADAEPWRSFVAARDAFNNGDKANALEIWKRIGQTAGIESRHTLQAWHFVRQAGALPPPTYNKRLLGVVLEVPMESGCDYLAAYEDRTARYINFTGAAMIWEHPNDSLDADINALLSAGQKVLGQIGPWNDKRMGPPPREFIRINLLTGIGLHFGQGPFAQMAQDAMAKPIIDAGTSLMKKLTEMR